MSAITRQQFIDAVEAGIEHATRLTDTERALLRHVARTENETVTGFFHRDGCFCPLSAAGLAEEGMPYSLSAFWMRFDAKMREYGVFMGKVQIDA